MIKLLKSNMSRLIRRPIFWVFVGLAFGASLFSILPDVMAKYKNDYYTPPIDLNYMFYGLLIGFAAGILCPMFVGEDYSSGVIRNKVLMGHSRLNIYFSALITDVVTAFALCLAYIIPMSAIGIPCIGFSADATNIAYRAIVMFIIAAECASIITLVSMLNSNRVASAVIVLGVFIGCVILTVILENLLLMDEYITKAIYDELGNYVCEETVLNPRAPHGAMRGFVNFLVCLNPIGQAERLSFLLSMSYTMSASDISAIMAYALGVTAVTTAIGAVCFLRKDIK